MKISSYYKQMGYCVEHKTDYNNLNNYDKVFISKVFTDTLVDENILHLPHVEYGGTGFYYDKAPPLHDYIEHIMPDYHLYDEWVEERILSGENKNNFKYYTDYSIGFLTRGCFRQCQFCVNRNYKRVEKHSPLSEFVDDSRKKICLLDDNFFGYKYWEDALQELQSTEKPFQFKQGLDQRLLTDDKCSLLFKSKYDGDYIFAFDNIEDYDLVEQKLNLIRKHTSKVPKFYVFCGFDRKNKWDDNFWKQDLWDLMKRIELLMKYHCLPYIMRFHRFVESPYKGFYITLARWCNQPNFFKKKTLYELAVADQNNIKSAKDCSTVRYIKKVSEDMPDLAARYFNISWNNKT